ncbi:MAG TPA: hypothetical protein VHW09_17105 [Bryobacteraceae bacterium]|jgi:hypothetical protein|nr:hypothetical protein [Bryobacteraceae bacterium]
MMPSGPARFAEAIVGFFVPPACREEVVGDLHERYRSPLQYVIEALFTVPLVIVSRIRRTADVQIVAMQGCALYMSFLGAAWLGGGAVFREPWSILRLALPGAMVLAGVILDDAYARPGVRLALQLARGPFIGNAIALACQAMLWGGHSAVAIPPPIAFSGCAMSLLFSSGIRLLFPPLREQPLGATAPAFWLKRGAVADENSRGLLTFVKVFAVVLALAALAAWILDGSLRQKAGFTILLVAVVALYTAVNRA